MKTALELLGSPGPTKEMFIFTLSDLELVAKRAREEERAACEKIARDLATVFEGSEAAVSQEPFVVAFGRVDMAHARTNVAKRIADAIAARASRGEPGGENGTK